MATATGNYVCDNSSLANFQAWTGALYTAIETFGWQNTTDTGQAANPPAAVPSSTYVYRVYKANDTQASTCPIFMKVEVGYSTTSPRIQITTGTGSNGSGTITGAVVSSAPWVITNYNTNQGATLFPTFFSGDAGEFRMYMWQSASASTGVCFIVERSKDSSGNKTADYFTTLTMSCYTSTAYQQTSFPSGAVSYRENGIIGMNGVTTGSNTGAWGGNTAGLPCFPLFGKLGNPMLGLMGCCANDVADGTIVPVTSMYGGTHNYVVLKNSYIANCMGTRAQSAVSMAGLMRYE